MARKPMVTRTFETAICEVMTVNTVQAEIENKVVRLARTYKTDDEMLKAVKAITDTDEVKTVKIISAWTETKLYGMSENDFLKYAVELDAETRKPLNTDEEDEEDEEE